MKSNEWVSVNDENKIAPKDSFESWLPGQPNGEGNQQCGAIRSDTKKWGWDDRSCTDDTVCVVCNMPKYQKFTMNGEFKTRLFCPHIELTVFKKTIIYKR